MPPAVGGRHPEPEERAHVASPVAAADSRKPLREIAASPSSCPVVGSDLGPGGPTPAATSDALRLAWSLTGVPRCAGSVPVPAWQESTLDPANPPRLTLPRSGSDVRVSQLTRSRPGGRPRPSLVRWNDLTASTGRGGEPKARNGPPNGRDSRLRGRPERYTMGHRTNAASPRRSRAGQRAPTCFVSTTCDSPCQNCF